MTWKTLYRQEAEEIASPPPQRFPFDGAAILVGSGLFWFSIIGAGLWLVAFF